MPDVALSAANATAAVINERFIMVITFELVALMAPYYSPSVTKIFHQPYDFVNYVPTRTSPSRQAKLNAVKKIGNIFMKWKCRLTETGR